MARLTAGELTGDVPGLGRVHPGLERIRCDLDRFERDCAGYDCFVTFCGATFDLPVLATRFPRLGDLFRSRIHVDLCPLYRRLGHKGGLKAIERAHGIPRTPETDGLSGYDAVRLWRVYAAGGRHAGDALRLLIAYNREDVVNLDLLVKKALPRLRAETGFDIADCES